jgi:hypothetical protein
VPPSTVQANKIVGAMSEVHAINTAIRRASGEFILRLDQDTIIGPNFTYFLVQALANRSALLSDDVIWWSSRRETQREDYEAIIQNPVQTILSRGRDSFPIYDSGKLESVLDGVGAVGVLGMSKRLWTSVEGYDERLTGIEPLTVGLRVTCWNILTVEIRSAFKYIHIHTYVHT